MCKYIIGVSYFTNEIPHVDAPTGDIDLAVKADTEAEALKSGIKKLYRNPPSDFDCPDRIFIKEKLNG